MYRDYWDFLVKEFHRSTFQLFVQHFYLRQILSTVKSLNNGRSRDCQKCPLLGK